MEASTQENRQGSGNPQILTEMFFVRLDSSVPEADPTPTLHYVNQ